MITEHPTKPKFHFILLGASNLARARFGLNQYLEKSFPNLISTSIASGPGRAYSVSAGIFGINYSPLKASPIFNLGREESSNYRQTIALISDIGNDIMYGVPVQKLIQDLENSILNLSGFCSHVFILPIPSKKIESLNHWQINILKRILFPKCTLSPEKIISSIQIVNQFLSELNTPKLTLLKAMDDCIGWDRAHYDLSKMHIAWTKIVDQITQELSIKPNRNINQALMFRSFINYWKDLIFCDAIPLISRNHQEYY
jgi:hypothetical protein